MLQPKRSNTSKSLFREAQYAIVVLDEAQKESFFKNQIQKVVRNRKDPTVTFTGAKALKTQFLAALSQLGEVKTANIWARKLLIDLASIKQLQMIIEETLRQKNIYGVTEIHLQDPEINSSHIQFVGIKAQEAELEIAKIIVKLGYETDIASAMGRKLEDATVFEIKDEANTQDEIDEADEMEVDILPSAQSLIDLKAALLNELFHYIDSSSKHILKSEKMNLRKLDNQALKSIISSSKMK